MESNLSSQLKSFRSFTSLFLLILCQLCFAQVKVWEGDTQINTYFLDPPDVNPRFYEGRGHQGVQKHIYPFPMHDGLTDVSEMKSYKTIFVENEYIKISIIPELGGRIFSAYDKLADYDFIYKQDAIKPSLVGMAGKWITGAIAWGFPHHHGPHTMAPYEHITETNPDGSVTVWISKFDLRHRVRGLIGITIRPDNNVISVTGYVSNPTAYTNSFLFWTNPSVKADESYQVIFDPSVQWVTFHGKKQMLSWPIADDWWRHGVNYTGVDVSLWRNIKRPTSFFTIHPEGDYFGGYSHKYDAGTVCVGNHHITPGMKCWEYGPNPEGNAWIRMVTDNAGHNIELMAGAYTDNQPDYSFLHAYEVKHFTQNWFPISKTGGFDYANLNGAMNIDLDQSMAKIRINATSTNKDAKLVISAKDKTLFDKTISISPREPFIEDYKVTDTIEESDIKVSLSDSSGKILMEYRPKPKIKRPKPEVTVLPGDPKDYKSVEELYLAGLRLVQFYNPVVDPKPYFEEALRRDPGNYNVNVFLGTEDLKQKRWVQAEEKLTKAVDRVTYNNTRPKSCEGHYYLGIVQRKLKKRKEAYDNFYRATWDYTYNTAGYAQLAEMDIENKDYARALMHLDRAISTNDMIKRLKVNKAIALRKLGHLEKAEKLISAVIDEDKLDFFARNELYIIQKQKNTSDVDQTLNTLTKLMNNDVQNYLEVSTYYSNLGLNKEAINVLERMTCNQSKSCSKNPILYYTLGHLWNLESNETKAYQYLKSAAIMPWQYCFPWREETIPVLQYAKEANPTDAMASYFLGCLYYGSQPDKAIKEWEYSRSINDQFSYTHRNLAWGYNMHQNDITKAIASMEKAISLNKQDARFFYEMDILYEKAGAPFEKRLKMLQDNHTTVKKRDDALTREALVLVQVGRYDDAIKIYEENHFNFWEGVRTAISIFQDANILRGIKRYNAGDYKGALADFKMSFAYPPNVDMGPPHSSSRYAQLYYYTAMALEAIGNKKEAMEYYTKAVSDNSDNTVYLYYQVLAHRKLKHKDQAQKTFDKLNKYANRQRGVEDDSQFSIRKTEQMWLSNKYYALGLCRLAEGNKEQAKEYFTKAVNTNPNLWASFWLKEGLN